MCFLDGHSTRCLNEKERLTYQATRVYKKQEDQKETYSKGEWVVKTQHYIKSQRIEGKRFFILLKASCTMAIPRTDFKKSTWNCPFAQLLTKGKLKLSILIKSTWPNISLFFLSLSLFYILMMKVNFSVDILHILKRPNQTFSNFRDSKCTDQRSSFSSGTWIPWFWVSEIVK